MIEHRYTNASDDLPQYIADTLDRQEVTADWYLDYMAEKPVWAWVSTEAYHMGLEPWRLDPDIDIAKAKGWRLFIQRRDLCEKAGCAA
jgi:hypothetical protein